MRVRPAVLAIFTATILSVAPAAATTSAGGAATGPAIGPPEPSHQVDAPRGPGVRSAGFMDYTDDACSVCDGRIVIGLAPGGAYRIAAMPDVCGVPFEKPRRVFSYPITADGRGTYWSPGRAVTLRGLVLPRSVRILKGTSGTTEVACGNTTDLTDELEHPFAGEPVAVGRFTGPDRHGLVIAVGLLKERTSITTVLADIPGGGPIRVRGTDRPCGSGSGEVTLSVAPLAVSARRTAGRTETVDNNETITIHATRSVRLGGPSSPFTQVRCRDAVTLATIED